MKGKTVDESGSARSDIHQNQLSLRHPKPHHSRWWCNWGLTLRKPRKSRGARKWTLQGSRTQGDAQHHGLQPQGQGWKKASSPPEHGDCLSASEQLRTCQEVSCRKKSGCRGAQSDLELHSTWPCVYNPGKTKPRSETENWGREEITAKEDLMHSDSCVTLVAWQQYWLGWPVSTKRLCDAYFRNGLKMESYVTDTLHWKNLLLKWREKQPTHHHPPRPLPPIHPPLPALVD